MSPQLRRVVCAIPAGAGSIAASPLFNRIVGACKQKPECSPACFSGCPIMADAPSIRRDLAQDAAAEESHVRPDATASIAEAMLVPTLSRPSDRKAFRKIGNTDPGATRMPVWPSTICSSMPEIREATPGFP